MTIEEKAKAYDNIIQRVTELYETRTSLTMEQMERLFPELRESEDERIRKQMIDFISTIKGISESGRRSWEVRKEDAEMCNTFLKYLEKQKEQKPVQTAKEAWKEMRLEAYAQASGNRHEPNYSDDSTKMFSLCDIDEIFEKIGNSTVGSQPAEWSEEDEKHTNSILERLEGMCKKGETFTRTRFAVSEDEDWLKSLPERFNFQPKQKWGENAWQRLKMIAEYLRYKGYEEDADFIESIPPQQKKEGIKGINGDPDPAGVWKPSDGQLKALKYFLAHHRLQRDTSTTKWEEYDELQSLYDILCTIAKSCG